ncbi:MAG: peptidoglycan-binding domain-containing protein [Thermohalobaculum sp.]|nr:peptidoglycan-binding domain-containing protein [Thermohalobaculum sp.]
MTLSDPVTRLGDAVRAHGPIVIAADGGELGALPSVLSGLSAGDIGPAAVPEGLTATVAAETPSGVDHDAHLWDYLVASAPAREAALGLGRAGLGEVQRRLELLGYETAGVDGVMGPRSRAAIERWQRDYGFAPTGYLDDATRASIEERSAEQWAAWQSEQAQTRMAARAQAAPAASVVPADRAACQRGEDGRIIDSQGFGCGLKGVREGFQRLFSKLGDPNAAVSPPPAADR